MNSNANKHNHLFMRIMATLVFFLHTLLLIPFGWAESRADGATPSIKNCYSRASVNGSNYVGGLVGKFSGGVVEYTYAAGHVSGNGTNVGGLLGSKTADAPVTASYWDTNTSGQSASAGGHGRTAAQMKYPHGTNTYVGWDFQTIWAADPESTHNSGYPYLRRPGADPEVTATATANVGGRVTPGARTVAQGATAQFTVTPNAGYTHGRVSGTCPAGSFNINTFTTGPITVDCTVIFNFNPGPSDTQPLSNLQIGDKVLDSSWTWEQRTGPEIWNGVPYSGRGVSKPIVWIVAAKDHYGQGSGITLVAGELIGRFPFDTSTHISEWGYSHWGESGTHSTAVYGLRPWLNSTGKHSGQGFYQTFSQSFKDAVVETNLPNKTLPTGTAYTTRDKVFIASAAELGDMEHKDTYAIGTPYPLFRGADNAARIAVLGNVAESYWTRSPNVGLADFVGIIMENGSPTFMMPVNSTITVRPAVNVSSATLVSRTPNDQGCFILGGQAQPGHKTLPGVLMLLLDEGR